MKIYATNASAPLSRRLILRISIGPTQAGAIQSNPKQVQVVFLPGEDWPALEQDQHALRLPSN